ncbi:MAG: hypothetical protein FWD83_01435 [Promicromonosporaceae bacterium]|nr:hypothetical protein [Promicromonosporaceae bacterium]
MTEQPTPESIEFDRARTEEVLREALSDQFTLELNDSRREVGIGHTVDLVIELMEEHRIRGAVSASAAENFFLDLDIVCENGRNIRFSMSPVSGWVERIRDLDTGEWLYFFVHLGVGMPDD